MEQSGRKLTQWCDVVKTDEKKETFQTKKKKHDKNNYILLKKISSIQSL